jgi:hypothetical protein
MSAEVSVLVFAPAIIPLALAGVAAGGAVWALGRASDAIIERQRREREARFQTERAVERYESLRRHAERAHAEFAEVDLIPPLPGGFPPIGDGLRAQSATVDLSARAAAAERRLQEQLGLARSRRIVAGLQATINRIIATSPAPTAPRQPVAVQQQPAQLGESLRRVLARLDPAAAGEVIRQLEEWATQALSAPSPAAAQMLLDDLRYSVEKANRAVKARRTRLAELAARTRTYSGPHIDEALAAIAAAEHDPDPDFPGLAAAVSAAIGKTTDEAVRAYTLWALRDSLQEIGCEVQEGFDSLLTGEGMAHLTREGWEDLAVRVRSRPDSNTAHFNMVAPRTIDGSTVGSSGIDPSVEEQWCKAFDDLLPKLAERGVEVHVEERSVPGEAQAQEIDPARYPFERRRRARRDESRRRELPR